MRTPLLPQNALYRLSRYALLSILFASLTGCLIEKPPVVPPNPPTPSLANQIKTLEDNGTIPKLDRSTDIKGPDANNNGVRDDIDAWIATLPITEIQKKAAIQTAIGLQKTLLVDLNDKIALQAVWDESMLSTVCLSDAYMPEYKESFKLSSKIEAMTANTKERAKRYILYNAASSGSSTKLPNSYSCN
jgi:hypothetical protein